MSKDPSTKCGAVIADGKRIVSMGFNGFPAGIPDTPEDLNNREVKMRKVIHAEMNAILFARRPVDGFTLYTHPFPPCTHCAAFIIQAGINVVYAPAIDDFALWARHHVDDSLQLFDTAGVRVYLVDMDQ